MVGSSVVGDQYKTHFEHYVQLHLRPASMLTGEKYIAIYQSSFLLPKYLITVCS